MFALVFSKPNVKANQISDIFGVLIRKYQTLNQTIPIPSEVGMSSLASHITLPAP